MAQDVSDPNSSEGRQPVSPIMRLPGELIAEIFLWCILGVCGIASRISYSLPSDTPIPNFDDSPAPYSWLIIRHVCHAWREVALTYPQLSTHIFLTRPECVRDVLSRAGTLPLRVYEPSSSFIHAHLKDVIASSKIALGHLKYISHGSLIFRRRDFDSVQGLAATTNSCVRSLRLIIWHRDSSNFPIPSVHFSELRDLTCRNADVTRLCNVSTMQHLRTLKLIYCRRIAVTDLVELLRPAQRLEDLTLKNVIEETEDWPHIRDLTVQATTRKRISLPHLRHLSICENGAAIGLYLLSHIDHPSSTAIHLSFSWLSRGAHSACDCLTTILLDKVDNWGHLATTSSQSLYLFTHDHIGTVDCCYLKLWQHHLPFTAEKDDSDHPFDPAFFVLSLSDGDKTFFTSLLRRLFRTNITAASLTYKTVLWDVIDWGELLPSFSSVRELRLNYYTSGSSDAQLYHMAPRDSDTQLLCPRLRLLYIDKEHLSFSLFNVFSDTEFDPPVEPPSSALALSRLAGEFVARGEPHAGGSYDGLPGSLAAGNSGLPSDDVAV